MVLAVKPVTLLELPPKKLGKLHANVTAHSTQETTGVAPKPSEKMLSHATSAVRELGTMTHGTLTTLFRQTLLRHLLRLTNPATNQEATNHFNFEKSVNSVKMLSGQKKNVKKTCEQVFEC